jgi:tetratricopeptide (TPR) repeat protein
LLYSKAIDLNVKSVDVYRNRGLLRQEQLDDPKGALADYNKAIAISPTDAGSHYYRATVKLEHLKNRKGAIADLKKAVKLAKAEENNQILELAEKMLKDLERPSAKKTKDTKQVSQAGEQNKPIANSSNNTKETKEERAASLTVSGFYKQMQGDSKGALVDYDEAIALIKNNIDAYRNRGELKQKQLNDPKGALADYNSAISLKPTDSASFYLRGTLKFNNFNDKAGAIADLEKAVKLAKQDGNSQVLELAQEDLKQLTQLSVKVSSNPQNAEKARSYVQSYLQKNEAGDYQAKEDLDKAISIDPDDGNLYIFRGILKSNQFNDISGALADYDRGIKIEPYKAYYYAVRGTFKRKKTTDKQGAIADFRMALSLENKQKTNPELINLVKDELKLLGLEE